MLRRSVLALALALAAAITKPHQAGAAATSEDVVVDGLAATWMRPAAPSFPAALIIAGSGPTDRDGNNALGIKTDSYRRLAEALAARGIASMRFDKRGVGTSKALVPSAAVASSLTIDDFTRDVERLARHVREQTGVTTLSLIGHSEGGLIALRTGSAVRVDGIVLLTSLGRTYADTLSDQLQRQPLPPDVVVEARRVIAALKSGGDVGPVAPPLDRLFAPPVHTFLRSVMTLDPAAALRVRAEPVLVIGGGKDIQVGRVDYDALAGARPERTTAVWLDEMTHVLKAFRTDDPAQTALYREPHHPLMPGLAERIADWIEQLPR